MNGNQVLIISVLYFLSLFVIAFFTARGATTAVFFNAEKKAKWYLVAFGMVGVAISGLDFLLIPIGVGTSGFSGIQRIFGYLLGYGFVATILLPIYYKLNLISIYSYFETRFGFWSQKTGAFFFLISRALRTAFRVFIVTSVLHELVFKNFGLSFFIILLLGLTIIFFYSLRGGIKTIIWTDVFNTSLIIIVIGLIINFLVQNVGGTFNEAMIKVQESKYSIAFFWETGSDSHFFKQFLSGVFIAVVFNGLDQDIMQKNLSCKNISDAQKNMFWFVIVLVIVNIFMLTLGALFFLYADQIGIQGSGSDFLINLLQNNFGSFVLILFFVGLLAACFSSTDSALISLTTSFCIDFLDFGKTKTGEATKRMTRIQVHLVFAIILFIIVVMFKLINNEKIVESIFTVASFTYGPLLGLFAFGLFTKWDLKDRYVPLVCSIAPIVSYLMNFFSEELFNGHQFGIELVILNGVITFLGLMTLIRKKISSMA